MRTKFGEIMTIQFDDDTTGIHDVRLVEDVGYEDGDKEITWDDGYQYRTVPVTDPVITQDGMTATFGTTSVLVRPVGPYDIKGRGPLPVDAIISSLQGGSDMDPIFALVDANGFVATLAQFATDGAWLRYGGAWQKMPPDMEEDPFDGWSVVDVSDAAIDIFDDYDSKGKLAAVTTYPALDPADLEPYGTVTAPDEGVITAPGDTEGTVTTIPAVAAAGQVLSDYVTPMISPILSSADLESAIETATTDPSIRWYVEKRAAALGYEDTLPWTE